MPELHQISNAQAAIDLAVDKLEKLKRHKDPDVSFRARYALGQLQTAALLLKSATRRMHFH